MIKGKLGAKGFSLVELMVVVAIIGILAAVAIPNFQRFQRKARQTEATAMLGAIHSAESAFLGQWEQYTTGLDTAGYVPDGTLKYAGGFSAAAAWSSGTAPTDYTGTGPTANISTLTLCAAYPARCTDGSALAVPAAGVITVGAGNTGNAATFTAAAQGMIGGALTDVWTIDQRKALMNTADGTL